MSVTGKFGKWCRERGGDFQKRGIRASCTLKNPISLRDVNSFLTFIDKNRDDLLLTRRYELCIEHYEKLPLPRVKYRTICYDSIDDEIYVHTHSFGEPLEELLKFVDVEKFKRNINLRLDIYVNPEEKEWSHACLDSEISYTEAKQNPKKLHTILKTTRILD